MNTALADKLREQGRANRARYIAYEERRCESLVLNLVSQGLDRATAERRVAEYVTGGGVPPAWRQS